jgi:hypothetical protein
MISRCFNRYLRVGAGERRTVALAGGLGLAAMLLSSCGPSWDPEEERAINALREIARGQSDYKQGGYFDADMDGEADYGTFEMLADPAGNRSVRPLINPLYTTGRVGSYQLNLQVKLGDGDKQAPDWSCYAISKKKNLRCFYVDESGVVRYEDRLERMSKSSPIVKPTDDPADEPTEADA